jgi:hypothetical protein
MYTYKALVEFSNGAPPAWRTVQASNSYEAKALLEAYGRVQMVPVLVS